MILLTGGNGFLGRYVQTELTRQHLDFKVHDREEDGDLIVYKDLVEKYNPVPNTVIHLAAEVGGIGANRARPYDFISNNLLIGLNMIDLCIQPAIKKFVMVSTVCAYPSNTPIPFKEEDIWNGYPEGSNAPYGIAKRTLTAALWAAKEQYGLNSVVLNLANLYGKGDSQDLANNHVIPAIIAKIKQAKLRNEDAVLWGDGSPTRDFLHAKDAAKAIVKSLELEQGPQFGINIGTGVESSIKDIAFEICDLIGYDAERIIWDNSKPNGQQRRVLDISKAEELLDYSPSVYIRDGLFDLVGENVYQ